MSVATAVAALAGGGMAVVLDAADREDEGDLVMAAQHVTPEAVNFMATHARGLICVPMTVERLDALRIGPMTARNGDPRGTAWRVSVDHRTTGTGISAHDRSATIHALADPTAQPEEFCRPGHVFPLAGRPGGVRERPGHTEAALELMRLAGLREAAVICEIAADDGSMARGAGLRRFAAAHGLPLLTIGELTEHVRAQAERLVVVGDGAVHVGGRVLTVFTYRDPVDGTDHRAVVAPGRAAAGPPLVAVHAECFGGDVLGGTQCCCAERLEDAVAAVATHPGGGVVAYVHEAARGGGCPLPAPVDALRRQARLAAGMLRDLGVERARLLDGSPGMRAALAAAGVQLISERLTHSGTARRRDREKAVHLQGKADMPNVLDTRTRAR